MKIKICGIKSVDEAKAVLDVSGVDFLGVIFAKSPRQISVQTAAQISVLAHQNGAKIVGVFGGINEEEIVQICKSTNLDVAQIYEPISLHLKHALNSAGCDVWRVFSVGGSLPDISSANSDFILFDTKSKKLGGSGVSFDWNLLKNLHLSFGIAGGLNASNIAVAAFLKPKLLDINSGVEGENFIKIPAKIKEIINILKDLKI